MSEIEAAKTADLNSRIVQLVDLYPHADMLSILKLVNAGLELAKREPLGAWSIPMESGGN